MSATPTTIAATLSTAAATIVTSAATVVTKAGNPIFNVKEFTPEKWNWTLNITIIGILVVFIVLITLMFSFNIMKLVARNEARKSKLKASEIIETTKSVNAVKPVMPSAPAAALESDESEEVAAIMGAISAMLGSNNYVIKSIQPAQASMPKFSFSKWGTVPAVKVWKPTKR